MEILQYFIQVIRKTFLYYGEALVNKSLKPLIPKPIVSMYYNRIFLQVS